MRDPASAGGVMFTTRSCLKPLLAAQLVPGGLRLSSERAIVVQVQ
jgi:hypothetical protein